MSQIFQKVINVFLIILIFELTSLAAGFAGEKPLGNKDMGDLLGSVPTTKERPKLYEDKEPCVGTSSSEEDSKTSMGEVPHPQQSIQVTVVIDVFRAFTTACYVLEGYPASYALATQSSVISRLASTLSNPLLIGKPEKGVLLSYKIPNSPTRVKEIAIRGVNVLHRTEAGAKGVLLAKDADVILATSFVNADATVKYIKGLVNPIVTVAPMGHEAVAPSLEDDLCAQYIKDLLAGKKMDLAPFYSKLREGPGKYFFSDDQWQYPSEDFEKCTEIGRFNFAIRAEVKDGYAILTRHD